MNYAFYAIESANILAVEPLLLTVCCSTTLVLCISSSDLLSIFPTFRSLLAWSEIYVYVFSLTLVRLLYFVQPQIA